MSEITEDQHHAGVHLNCKLAPVMPLTGARVGDGTSRSCKYAGKIERFHHHDFEGPLVCGCPEWGE